MSKRAAQSGIARRLAFLPKTSRTWTLLAFGAFALSILAAIWSLPGFLVQDGPVYLYNSHLMLGLFRPGSPFREYLAPDWRPLPYWGAYALLGVLMPLLPPRAADQVLMTLTSVGVASGLMWLRWRIAGWQGAAIVAPLVVVLSINMLWIYGLHSFLLGVILYCITLAYWWSIRERIGARHAALLAALVVAGYFCHLVSFGLTAIGLVVLAVATPGPDVRRRLRWTVVSLLPSVPLIIAYSRVMGAGGEPDIRWTGITSFLSPAEWLTYVFMADFPTIHEGGMNVPVGRFMQVLFALPPPSRWALVGLSLLIAGAVLRRSNQDTVFYRLHRGWIALAGVLLVGGVFGPSDIGAAQGFLRERVLLLGFATIVPLLRVNLTQTLTRAGLGLLTLAAVLQVCFVWDYALRSDRLVRDFMKAGPSVGTGHRVAAVIVRGAWPYRTSPIVHLPNMLGIGTGNLVWNNYGPALDYFPIKYRSPEARERSLFFGNRMQYYDFISPATKKAALGDYQAMMVQSHNAIDLLVMWSSTPDLDAINRQWFESKPVYESGRVKVLRHLGKPEP